MTRYPSQSGRYQKHRRIEREQGIERMACAAAALAHLDALNQQGYSLSSIGRQIGVDGSHLYAIRKGAYGRITRALSEKILAVTPESVIEAENPKDWLPIVGTKRRIQALMAIGYPMDYIDQQSGVDTRSVVYRNGRVARSTHDAVKRVYEELWATPGPSAETRNRALRSGYLPPMAWDDETIEDANHRPGTPEFSDKRATKRELFIRDVEHLASFGIRIDSVAHQLGMKPDALEKRLERYGRKDLLRKIGRVKDTEDAA